MNKEIELAKEDGPPAASQINNDPVLGYFFALLVASIYRYRVTQRETPLLPQAIEPFLIPALEQGAEFCKYFGLGEGNFHRFFDWIMGQRPPDKGGEFDERQATHLADLKTAMSWIKKDTSISKTELDLLASMRSYLGGNDNALENIRKKAGMVKAMPRQALQFLKAHVAHDDVTADAARAKELVKQMTGKDSIHVSMVDGPKLRETKPELWNEYLLVRRKLNAAYKSTLMNHVRENGGEPMPVEDVRKHFTENGMPHSLPPKEFKGRIGDDGALYTVHGSKIKGTAIAQDSKVIMNPQYDPAKDKIGGERDNNFVYQVVLPTKNADGENNRQYVYTHEKADANKAAKFQVVADMLKGEKKMLANWRKDLLRLRGAKPGEEGWDNKVLAAMCEITYLTALRIGGKGNKNLDGDTFGLSTLTVGMVKRRGATIILDYVGKKSVQQKHSISPATPPETQVVNVINALCADKKRADALWAYGRTVYSAAKLNAYLKQVSGIGDATIHKVRHLRGTRLAMEMLPPAADAIMRKRGGPTQKLVDDTFKAELTKIGKLLGHVRGVDAGGTPTWTTSMQNYIDPSVMMEFYEKFDEFGVRPMPALLKIA